MFRMPQEVNKKSRSDNSDHSKEVSLCRREEFVNENLHSAACSDLKDMKMRNRFCADKQENLEDDLIEERLVFGDDAAFSTNVKKHNVRIWIEENPHVAGIVKNL